MSSAADIRRWYETERMGRPLETPEYPRYSTGHFRMTQADYDAITRKVPSHPWQKAPTMNVHTRILLDKTIFSLKQIEIDLAHEQEGKGARMIATLDTNISVVKAGRGVLETVK